MLLVIDVGNTQTVFGVYQNKQLVEHFRLSSDRMRTEDEFAVFVKDLLRSANVDLKLIKHAILASVVPPLTYVMRRMCKRCFGFDPMLVELGIKTGMPVLYENPREVGADRIVNGIAGFERYKQSVIIVDFGTATTFDVISSKGEYLGGAIAPGIQISSDALFTKAAKLPRIEFIIPASAIGKTTITSLQSGILFGYVGLVDGMIERMKKEIDTEPKVIATGGLAKLIAPHSKCIQEVDDFLTLEGLRILHERNLK